jgi:hypothetical protein
MCGSRDLEYDCSDADGNWRSYPYTCQHCDFNGEEYYVEVFQGHLDSDTKDMLDDGTQRPNARFLDAAPKLLEACKEAYEVVEELPEATSIQFRERLYNAIAEAEK